MGFATNETERKPLRVLMAKNNGDDNYMLVLRGFPYLGVHIK
jgi:hypothetical protein